jgi:hypothetical protein
VGISLRDEKGQAFIEYILVLIVAVSIILGGIYQLNSAFKVWATNYFGNYLACLLETGELPAISGTGGDAGVCAQAFKPFSLADGRPLRTGAGKGSDEKAQNGGGQRERAAGSGGSSGYVAHYAGTPFTGGKGPQGNGGKIKAPAKNTALNTGNTNAINYGGYGPINQRLSKNERKTELDTKFAFDDEKEKLKRRNVASAPARTSDLSNRAAGIRLKQKPPKKDNPEDTNGNGFSFSDLLRYLIIAGIIIAILIFLGGQGLQIGKGMDG